MLDISCEYSTVTHNIDLVKKLYTSVTKMFVLFVCFFISLQTG